MVPAPFSFKYGLGPIYQPRRLRSFFLMYVDANEFVLAKDSFVPLPSSEILTRLRKKKFLKK